MKRVATFNERLQEAMSDHHLRQVDVVRLVKPLADRYGVQITQSLLSQYGKGIREPSRLRLQILAKVLGVGTLWLAGYDVEKTADDNYDKMLQDAVPETEIPIRHFLEIYKLLGYDVWEENGGYIIKKKKQQIFLNDERELLYKFHVLEVLASGLLQHNMYAEPDEVVTAAYRHFL